MQHKDFLPLFPEILPNAEHHIHVSELHKVYVASYGNVDGIPVIALHGGPGSCTSPWYAQLFDPKKYHIILADQRGSGRSLPKGEMNDNTTQHLIGDIEKIRNFFKIHKWVVFGGSWGCTLALLYAQAYPRKVLALEVRGVCLAREKDLDAHVREGSPAALLHGKEWERFKTELTDLIQKAGLTHLSVNKDKIYHIIYEILTNQSVLPQIKEQTAGIIAWWEKFNSHLEANKEDLEEAHNPDGINMGLTEAVYFENRCYIKPNQILDDIVHLKGIPVEIIQGKFDIVCPPYQADELEAALLRVNSDNPNAKNLIIRQDCIAGHSLKEPAIMQAAMVASNRLAARLELELQNGLK